MIGMRVLIAEDDPVSRRIVEITLRNWKYDVIPVPDGNQALEVLRADDAPRLALLDWMMPGKDGPQICREIRANPTPKYTYIILLTTRSGKADIAEGLEAGADDYVIKPFEAIELKARLLAGSRIIELEDQLLEAQEKLRHQATHDGLTGVWNRAAILDKLEIELQRSRRQGTPLTVMLADIDRFKAVNDTHGHQVGDVVLHSVAQMMSSAVRVYDAIGRYGGEEFLIVAPGCDVQTAQALSQRLHAHVGRQCATEEEPFINVTCSFGVVTTTDGNVDSEKLIRDADEALYRAKANGRDRIEVAVTSGKGA
jgi:two-component system cell cycle response regulator